MAVPATAHADPQPPTSDNTYPPAHRPWASPRTTTLECTRGPAAGTAYPADTRPTVYRRRRSSMRPSLRATCATSAILAQDRRSPGPHGGPCLRQGYDRYADGCAIWSCPTSLPAFPQSRVLSGHANLGQRALHPRPTDTQSPGPLNDIRAPRGDLNRTWHACVSAVEPSVSELEADEGEPRSPARTSMGRRASRGRPSTTRTVPVRVRRRAPSYMSDKRATRRHQQPRPARTRPRRRAAARRPCTRGSAPTTKNDHHAAATRRLPPRESSQRGSGGFLRTVHECNAASPTRCPSTQT